MCLQRTLCLSVARAISKFWNIALTECPQVVNSTYRLFFATGNIVHNYGFEALTYSDVTHRFWTTTESMLPIDGKAAGPLNPKSQNLLRLQAFSENLQPVAQYAYRMDLGYQDDFGETYVYGVPELLAMPDGRLLVLEPEANITKGGLSSQCRCKLYETRP